jgi:hypothetical protein
MGGWSLSWQVLTKKELMVYIYIAQLYIDINVTLILHKKKIGLKIFFFFRATKIGLGLGNPNLGAAPVHNACGSPGTIRLFS